MTPSTIPSRDEFRPDLQIARAIAVLCVLLFHLGVPPFKGGFIGVDVFFVLSGYFITRTLLAGGEKIGKAEILAFYNRRVRRILPLALFVCLLCLALAPFLLPTVEVREITKQALASAFGFPNIFWRDENYFIQTLFRPLLHFWSLGVEYHYYLIFPFLFLAMQKRKWAGPLFFGLSFVLCLYLTVDSPKAAFYWVPMRVWEFMLGYYAFRYEGKINFRAPFTNTVVSFMAIAVILATALIYDSANLFPAWALPPTLATFFLIVCGLPDAKAWMKIPSAILVWVGTVSFSIYLWHYPVIWAFTYEPFVYFPKPLLVKVPFIIALTLALSALSYHFIETPFRSKKNVSNKIFYSGIAGVFALMIAMGGIYAQAGYSLKNYSPEQKMAMFAVDDRFPYRCDGTKRDKTKDYKSCPLGTMPDAPVKNVLLAGDSHADSIKPAFISATEGKNVALYFWGDNCNPGEDGCDAALFLKEVKLRDISDFVFHGYIQDKKTYRAMEEILTGLKISGVRVHIIDQTPVFAHSVPTNVYKGNEVFLDRAGYQAQNEAYFDWKKSIAQKFPQTRFYPVEPILCPEECLNIKDGCVLYFDNHHLTISGARLLSPIVAKIYGFGNISEN